MPLNINEVPEPEEKPWEHIDWQVLADWLTYYASDRERFMVAVMLFLHEPDVGINRKIRDFPPNSSHKHGDHWRITNISYFNKRKKLKEKLRKMLLNS